MTIRTLDIGADKYPTYMRSVTAEPNPFLGVAFDPHFAGSRRDLQNPVARYPRGSAIWAGSACSCR